MGLNTDIQKEIWLKHIDVQERMLQLNSAPIAIEPESIQISGQKLRLKVCQTDKLDSQFRKIKSFFGISDEDINLENDTMVCDGCFIADPIKLSNLAEECQKYYIHLSKNPVIDGIIRSQKSAYTRCIKALKEAGELFAIDENGRLQITVTALRKLDEDKNFPSEILPHMASGIFSVTPSPAYFLRKWFSLECNHRLKYDNVRNQGEKTRILRKTLSIHNDYLSDSAIQKLNELWGLRLCSYDVLIKVSENVMAEYDFEKSIFDFSKSHNGVFRYQFVAKSDESTNNKSIINGKWQIDLLRTIYNSEFGEGNYQLNIEYNYIYIPRLFYQFANRINYDIFYQELKNKIEEDYISVSEIKRSIGVDFDWREDDPEKLRIELSNKFDDMEVSIFEDHRCNIEISSKNADWEKIETFLHESYSSLKTYISPKDGSMHFFQEYKTVEQSSQFSYSLSASLNYLRRLGCECEIHPTPHGKQKYLLRVDYNKIAESKEGVVSSLRGAEFVVNGHSIGKLFKVNFPELLIDISSSDYDFAKEGALSFNHITPNLDGDIEKIKRLKEAFDCITTGKGVKNTNISSFIFDASKATPTENIDYYTNVHSEYYQDIKNNLLNKHINPSQLNAIIKCLKTQDIALIQGPPGTGKSTAIAELIWQHIRLNPSERVLLTSETNLAVDNAIDRTVNSSHNLVKPIRFGSDERLAVEGKQFSIAAMEEWVETGEYNYVEESDEITEDENCQPKCGKIILENWLDNIRMRIDYNNMDSESALLWEHLLERPNKAFRQLIFEQYKSHCNVVGATCSSIGEKNTKNRPTKFFMNYCSIFGKVGSKTICKKGTDSDDEDSMITIPTFECKDGIKFTTVIQDESSKATPAELALPLIYGEKNIVIGDHRQLPPMLDKEEFP
jgi:flagellar biosynthesis GTPase FlhF